MMPPTSSSSSPVARDPPCRPTAPDRLRARCPPRPTRREPPTLPIPLFFPVGLRSHRTAYAQTRRRLRLPPTRLQRPNGPPDASNTLTASCRSRRSWPRSSRATATTSSASPELRQPQGSSPASIPAVPGPTTTTTRRTVAPAFQRAQPSFERSTTARLRAPPPRLAIAGGLTPAKPTWRCH